MLNFSTGFVNAVSNGMQGKFTWTEWGKDVGIAMGTSLVLFPLAVGGGHLAGAVAMHKIGSLGNGLLIKWGEEGSKKFIETCIKVATSVVNCVGQGGMNMVNQCLKEGKINYVSVIVSLAVGAFSGYSIGKSLIDESQIGDFMHKQMRILNDYFRESAQRPMLPEGVVRALIDHGPGHAVDMHGPNGPLAERFNDANFRGPASKYTRLKDLYSSAHDSVKAATGADGAASVEKHTQQNGWTKFEFDLTVSKTAQKSLRIDHALRSLATGEIVTTRGGDFGDIIRTVVKVRNGEIPQIVTCFPRLGPAGANLL